MPLAAIQAQLQQLYDLQLAYQVEDFLITDALLARRLGCPQSSAQETLLIRQTDDSLDLSLFVDASVLDRLASRTEPAHWDNRDLDDWWQALEGVSHFLCVVWRAERDRPTSALELELQAEVDKFLLTAATLGRHHGLPSINRVKQCLFKGCRIRQELPLQLQHRYRKANALAEAYCHQLHLRHSVWPPDQGLLSEIRRFYRLDGRTKEAHIRRLS